MNVLSTAVASAAAVVICFVLQCVVSWLGADLSALLLWPRDLEHWWGPLTAHVVHGGLAHARGNAVALGFGLGGMAFAMPRLLPGAVVVSALSAGVFAWCVAPAALPHAGASGIVCGVLACLLVAGMLRWEWRGVLVAIPVLLLYGGSWVLLLPNDITISQGISWQMHLGGFLGGASYALTSLRRPAR